MSSTVEEYSKIKSLINQGRFLEGYSLVKRLLTENEDDLNAQQLYALSLSKTGSPKAAMEFLEPIYKTHSSDPETAGILGGIYKEVFRKSKDSKYAILARDTYLKNFRDTGSYYTGINAATMSAIMGEMRKGRELAESVITTIGDGDDFWVLATIGEASLLVKKFDDARKYYLEAKKKAKRDWGKIISVHNQLWLLSHYMAYPSEILKLYEPPTIVAFVGHMLDKADRPSPRFPASIEDQVKQALVTELKIINAGIGYSSLACGGDILFAEAMLEAGGEMNIILPFTVEDFIETSVRFAGQNWVDRFRYLIQNSKVKFVTTGNYSGNDDLFSFQGKVIFGSAVLRGFRFHKDPFLITVLSDLDQKVREGGTRHMLNQWPYKQNMVNINPDNFIPSESVINEVKTKTAENTIHPPNNRRVLYLISAAIPDATSGQVYKLIVRIWERIKGFFVTPIVFQNEGNQVVVVFTSTRSSMEFATLVPDMVTEELPDYNFYMGLHAGPVYLEEKIETGYRKVKGRHVDIVKVIRENSTPFSILASESFASNLAVDQENFNIEYVGDIEVDKDGQQQEIFLIEKNTD